ncbi:transferrin-binding protein-like solute binding protein [Psychrobacter sp. CAM01]|uniref:transferrin-binding protein-like solute binding protein n=1 Tax=Psychrobacter sp. CAM01 TaxID=3080335 RepID=UPI002935B6E3|nr:transferrin-binding protein-like solute binding protein [Psychrobacter sp. CAM01]MDV2860396.1 transferrin-binding protein-like solute binding protein [Psychrobacter sp. CAM01]
MSLNRHSISAVATAKKLKTPLKASVVILTTVILASCASDGGDNTTPKPSPTIPKGDSGTAGGSETEGSGVDTGSNAQAEAAIKAAEAKTKAAEDALKQAKAKTKAAEDALKAAEMKFGVESKKTAEASQKAIDAARSEAAKAKAAAEAARVEAVAKIEAAAQEVEGKIKAAKEAAAKEAVAKVKAAEANAKAAEARANTAEAKAKELQDLLASETAAKEAAEAKAKLEAKKAAEAAKKQAAALAAANSAKEAKEKAETTLAAAEKAKAEAIKAQQAAEKALEDVLANGGGSDALQKEAERKAKLAQQAQAQAESAQAAAKVTKQAAEAQTALALAAKKAAEDALAAATINHAPEATKSGVQSLNINAGTLGLFNTTTRDFAVNEDGSAVDARADIASQKEDGTAGLLPLVPVTISGEGDTEVANGFKSHKDETDIVVAAIGQTLPLTYNSTYKDFGDDMRIGHIDGSAEVALLNKTLPVNGVAVIGNATQAANMPTEGKVGYTGDATYRKLGIGNDIEFGKSVFTADFVAKNVKGDLTFDKAGKIGLTADINGNQFSGTAADNAGYNTEGGFFGGDAQYLGGVYEGNGAQGTYGAKSDKQTAAEKAAAKAQAEVEKAQAATVAAQAQAAAAKAAADKANADAQAARKAAEKAQKAADNAGDAGQALKDALERATEAERLQAAAEEAARVAVAAAQAESAAMKAAADAAIADAAAKIKAAEALAAQGDAAAAAAKKEAEAAKIRAENAQAAALTAKKKAEDAVKQAQVAESEKQAALQAKAAAEARATEAQAQAVAEKQKAEKAQAEADQAKDELATAQQKLAAAEQALADALANGGNTEALQAEVDRRQAALDAANAKATAAQQAKADAQAAAEAQIAAAQQATQAAADALAASQIKNAPETAKSGVQHISIDATGLNQGMLTTTTRDFGITDETQVQARADIASRGLVSDPVALQVSGDNDTAVAGSSGFNSFENTTKVVTATLGEQDLVYTSTYKDFSDDLRVAHIDGAAAGLLPVNGVAVVGNATQTANMPTEGKVGYTGDATYRETGLDKNIQFGTSVFTADFVAKNLKGDLDFGDKKIGLEATIAGNQFSGSKEGYKADGGFFGGDAQYLGGVYEGNGAQGTYGAKSDLQTAAEQAAIKAQADADAANAAIAGVQAQAAAAKAAAEKAQADAIKAQEALAKAEENLANAGNGEDLLAAALERAAAAEAAEAAALEAAATAEAARLAAENARAAAVKAQETAEAAAQQAIGDADEQKAAKERAEAAQTAAEKAKEEALTAKAESDKAKDEALLAKTKAETARDEAVARAEAAEAEALEAANAFSAPDSIISGFQSTSINSDDGTFENDSNSYNQLKVYANEVDGRTSLKPIDVTLRGANKGVNDSVYNGDNNGFKEYKGSVSFEGRLNNYIHDRDMEYSSVYKNFDDQMQVGHIFGNMKNGIVFERNLSNTYVQGNATNLSDMDKLTNVNEGKAKYKGVASYIEGGEISANGKSKFDVDFVVKSLKGELTFTDKQVDIAADITNNTFASKKGAAVNTVGGFYGKGASHLGGVYEREDNSGYIKGTYGATKVDPSAEPEPEPVPEPKAITGVMSNTISSVSGLGTDDAIGYRQFVTDNQTFTTTTGEGEDTTPDIVEDSAVDNLPSYDKFAARLDIVKPNKFKQPAMITTVRSNDVAFDADSGFMKSKDKNVATFKNVGSIIGDIDLKYNYDSVYRNFDTQMQIGHVYGDLVKESGIGSGVKSRYTNVYVMGQATENMPTDGNVQYAGVATYMDNLHLGSGAIKDPVVNGTSTFNVDFVNDSMTGELTFAGINKNIGISANITGNTFAGSKDNIATSGGFYGDGAKFLGGIYQEAQPGNVAGTGTTPGTGTTFQGTFGAEKQ